MVPGLLPGGLFGNRNRDLGQFESGRTWCGISSSDVFLTIHSSIMARYHQFGSKSEGEVRQDAPAHEPTTILHRFPNLI